MLKLLFACIVIGSHVLRKLIVYVMSLFLVILHLLMNVLFTRPYGSSQEKPLFIRKFFLKMILLLASDVEICPGPVTRHFIPELQKLLNNRE